MFFDSWSGLLRIPLAAVLAYFWLLIFLRISGNRTLSKMNAFDFVVTVALGSTLATVIISKEVPLTEGALALALLVGLQYILTWLSVRMKSVEDLVKSSPRLLFRRGEFLQEPMKIARVTEGKVRAAVRSKGNTPLREVAAVVLETDGSLSVLTEIAADDPPTLRNVVQTGAS
jgi:uncharacterized membrane protein YcaP (DUF421 family)